MTTVAEGVNAVSQNGPDLAGLRAASLNQQVVFAQYVRYVLPLDGYVFWLRTQQTVIPGSLHVATDKRQNEDETIAVSRVVFTSGDETQPFNALGPDTILVAEFSGIKFAFSRQDAFYRAAGLYHYSGDAVYPAMETQLVDLGAQLPELVVSNSLPVWLALKSYAPVWLVPTNPAITLYPSFAVPDNIRPPYGSVHIVPEGTHALQGAPRLGRTATHTQLTTDHVRITLYGTSNQVALDFLDTVNRYSVDTDAIGIMNMPLPRDDKRTQAELGILAQRKTIEFDVSYYQTRVNTVARQLLESVLINFLPQPYGVQ